MSAFEGKCFYTILLYKYYMYITDTRVVLHLACRDTLNITLVVSRVARSDTPNRGDAMSALHAQPASPIKYNGLTHTVLSSSWHHAYSYVYSTKWPYRKNYEYQKYEKKSPIHENSDASITCNFGDGDISHSRSRLPHGQPNS